MKMRVNAAGVGHGGKRANAGRKKLNKIKRNYSLSIDVVEFLKKNDKPASHLIDYAVRETFKLDTKD